jgi:Zn-finger nucleic acid-binding protein
MRCPRCDLDLDGRPAKCDQCRGCWVAAVDVTKTVKSSAPNWTDAGPSKIACPECYATMRSIMMNGVELDRCAQHGVWFDIDELTEMLRKTGKLGPEESARQDKPTTASKAGEGAVGVGGAILEVVGAVFEIVT